MHRFASACISTLLRTLPPPHVASWQSWLRDGFIRRQKLRRHRWNWTSSCRPAGAYHLRGRSHLLKAATVRLGQFRILKPDTKNESTTNTRLTTHSSSASPPPSFSRAVKLLLVANSGSQVARDVRPLLRQSERCPHVRRRNSDGGYRVLTKRATSTTRADGRTSSRCAATRARVAATVEFVEKSRARAR